MLLEYKLIRKSLENSRRYNEAAPMFIHEMTLSQNELKWINNFFEKAAHYLYRGISAYGESINRPIILAFLFITFFTLYFAGYNEAPTIELHMISQYYTEVFSVFLQLKSFKDLTLIKEMPLIHEILIRLASLTIFGNLYIALRRRLERK